MKNDLPDLLKTEVHLVGLLGQVEPHDDYLVLRTPSNPGFYHGNFLLLAEPPEDLDLWMARFERAFGPTVKHRCLEWVGGPLEAAAATRAAKLGLLPDSGIALALDAAPYVPAQPALDWMVRRLDVERDWGRIEALNRRCDPAEADSPPSYQLFKARIRESMRRWMEMGAATWWGAFDGDKLVGQCGLVVCEELGRFQAVETDPGQRRLGVCSALVAAVARDAFERRGCRRVLLEADSEGPAIDLYRRLGFKAETPFHSLIRPSESLHVRREALGDHAAVRSLLQSTFEGGEAGLVEGLRDLPGAISLVATQSGAVIGHVLFTPVTVEGRDGSSNWTALALGPMAVRVDRQRGGVGTFLLKAGLDVCRRAGHGLCFVLGHPRFYPRAEFRPAPPLGLRCTWPVPDEVFMVVELEPGAIAGRTGLVRYDPAFSTL